MRIESSESAPVVFISASPEDSRWRDEVVAHLCVLERQKLLTVWHDDSVLPGDMPMEKAAQAIERAAAAVLLISRDWLNSEDIGLYHQPGLQRRQQRGLWCIPLIVRACAWQGVPWLSELQPYPRGGRPLAARDKHGVEDVLSALASLIQKRLEGTGPGDSVDERAR